MKNNKIAYLFSVASLIIGILLMEYLVRVYVVGILVFFILIAFQTPSTKPDPTGEANDANINILKVTGLYALLYLAGGYIAAIFL